MPLNLPNLLTFFRIAAVGLVIGLMFLEPPLGPWLALGVYAAASLTDFLDGYLARVLDQHSALGRFLDPIADKLLVAAVLVMVVARGSVDGPHVLPVLVILGREILVSGLREFLAQLQVGVPVSQLAKWKTLIQMVALGFLIVGEAGPSFGPVDTLDIGLIGLWSAALITLITGYDYLRAGLRHIAGGQEGE
jgi:cardiolipin synthase (CMP-forming)